MIAVIDHGMGNLGSVQNMLRKLGVDSVRTADPIDIARADKIIIAGIGAFDGAMARLNGLGLVPILNEQVLDRRTPVLGICLGMQLMAGMSEEGQLGGLGWLDARVQAFEFGPAERLPIPHMGWQVVTPIRDSQLLPDDGQERRFYFSHGYHLVCNQVQDIAATATYGYSFPAAVERDNIFGTQFHPEKSHVFGMDVYRRFVDLPPT
jgi:glutamine amidotransferase